VFVDVIPVSAVLYIINFANCYQNGPQKARKEAKEEREGKAITIEKKKEIVQTYESGVRVTDLANMYSMSKSTISTILQRKDLYNRCIHLLNDNVMSYYRTVLKKKQRQP